MRKVLIPALMAFFVWAAFCPGSHAATVRSGLRGLSHRRCISRPGKLVTLDSIQRKPSSGRKKKGTSAYGESSGTKFIDMLVIVVEFSNVKYSETYDWGSTVFGEGKTLKTFYEDMSFGKLAFRPVEETSAYGQDGNRNLRDQENDGVVHITLEQDHDDWSFYPEETSSNNYTWFTMINNALKAAENYVDFVQYDINKDKKIDNSELAVELVVAGYEASAVYKNRYGKNDLWAHQSSNYDDDILSLRLDGYNISLYKPEGVTITDYVAVAEEMEDEKIIQESIGVMIHETGHFLGLPDLYDTSNGYYGDAWDDYEVGSLSVMDYGEWGRDSQGNYYPNSMDPWCRCKLGFIEPEVVENCASGAQALDLIGQNYDNESSGQSDYRVYKIPTPNEGEYYLVENRSFSKWDETLGKEYSCDESGGLVLWHIDDNIYEKYKSSNQVNAVFHRPAVMPLYKEEDVSGNPCMIGCMSSYGACVDTSSAFFTPRIWEEKYRNMMGSRLFLPMYNASQLYKNDPEKRTLTTIGLSFGTVETAAGTGTSNAELTVDVHKNLYKVEGKKPVCIHDGNIEYWACGHCSRLYTSDRADEEIYDRASLVIPHDENADHVWDDGIVTKEATEYEEGVLTYTCTNCKNIRTEPIPRLPKSDLTLLGEKLEAMTGNGDAKGAVYRKLQLKSKTQGNTSVTLTWKAVRGAEGYVIYGGSSAAGSHYKMIMNISDGSKTTYKQTGLKKGRYYKYIVAAYRTDNNSKKVLSVSKTIHVVTNGGKYTNSKAVSLNKKKLVIKKGKKASIKAITIPVYKKLKQKTVRKVRYESSNTAIASVSSSGKVKAVRKGSCIIYVYSQSGVAKKEKITVK